MHLNTWMGHKTRLRALTTADARILLESHQDSDAWRHGDDIKLPPSLEKIELNIQARNQPSDNNCWLAIVDPTGALVGTVNVHGADQRHANFEYGVHIFREYRQMGYASEAVRLLMRFYFQELGYHRMWATVYEFNEPSLALHQHLGFQAEGRLRENLYTNGRYWDEVIFGLLANEAANQIAKLPALPDVNA